ncbi:hypothetical protein ACJ6X8_27935 [Pseudomonas alvandae]|uniref:hypothetical protein n=1 Tax=Pseudomonas TaxID=286 RepID=UPI003899F44C
MSTTETRIAHALGLIDAAEESLEVRFATAYATGYVDALYDAQLVQAAAVQRHRDDAQARRARRLTELGAGDQV